MKQTKKEIRARIEELQSLLSSIPDQTVKQILGARIKVLQNELSAAPEDFIDSVLESHRAICRAKNMGAKEAYGQEPIMYYSLAICGEAGEMANKIVKGLRDGYNNQKSYQAVMSELPDILIYSIVLAHVMDIDIGELINNKVEIVIQRAVNGYYGGKINNKST
jgi:NTP pyrophosphatase (non-canonical NTP hydrolase)